MEIDGIDVRAAEVVGWQRPARVEVNSCWGAGPDERLGLYPFLFPRYPHPRAVPGPREEDATGQSVLASQVDAV